MPYWWHSTALLVPYLHSRVCYIILRARFIDFLFRFCYTVPQNPSLALRFAPFLLNLHVCTEIYCCLHSFALALELLPFAWETAALRSPLCSQIFCVINNSVEIYQPIVGAWKLSLPSCRCVLTSRSAPYRRVLLTRIINHCSAGFY